MAEGLLRRAAAVELDDRRNDESPRPEGRGLSFSQLVSLRLRPGCWCPEDAEHARGGVASRVGN